MKSIMKVSLIPLLLAFLLLAAFSRVHAQDAKSSSSQDRLITSIDLSQSLEANSGWRLIVIQGPNTADPAMMDPIPGKIRLCVTKDGGASCFPSLDGVLRLSSGNDEYSDPRYLNDVRIVRPLATRPILLMQVASQQSVNGNQRLATVALAYDHIHNSLALVYEKQTGKNNDEEIRYIADGPLMGAIISAEPTSDAPFGFWITVNRLGASGNYNQVLRYRSATRYNDGNRLAVIDSEMPGILQRLHLWHPGMRLPRPAGACAEPRLIGQEMWCQSASR
jgi:hypothetical protein